MEKCNHEHDVNFSNEEEEEHQHQLGYVTYVQCNFCTTILWVGVPCSKSLLKMATVSCGHCTGLLSVCLAPTTPFYFPNVTEGVNCGDALQAPPKLCGNIAGPEEGEDAEERSTTVTVPVVNKPPEKRERAPSTYNSFIREEIKRIKARDPTIGHKEAFSTAAKNWAHFPRIQHKSRSY
ncbi:INO-like YABBY protein [Rhynchospora pubera]|uniref:INO-like YABBY protein n=1 Tax=Rhynchospora pubera TaxID=906938 RepID=A0AAV8EUF7_9POAL|nr:INO-like YABBY protein [Rhynchospora pubera]